MSQTKRSGNLGKILVTILVVILVLLVVAEFAARWFVGHQLKTEYEEQVAATGAEVKEDPSVHFGLSPLLLNYFRDVVPTIDADLPDTVSIQQGKQAGDPPEIAGLPASQLHFDDLNIADTRNLTAKHLRVHANLTDEYLLASLQRGLAENSPATGNTALDGIVGQASKVTGVHSDPARGAIMVQFADGLAELAVKPTPSPQGLNFAADSASVLGFQLPPEITQRITQALQDGAQRVTKGLKLEDAKVQDGGLDITVGGNDVNISELKNQVQ